MHAIDLDAIMKLAKAKVKPGEARVAKFCDTLDRGRAGMDACAL